MHKCKLLLVITGFILLITYVTGCSSNKKIIDDNAVNNVELLTMENQADLTYEVPRSVPHILVNQLGYEPDSVKQVFFYGNAQVAEYKIHDNRTNEVVYEGTTEAKPYDEELGYYVEVGDFSDFSQIGEYYIEASLLGNSYKFEILNSPYEELLTEGVRYYYYNRCGITITDEYAKGFAHNACHTEDAVLRSDITTGISAQGGWHQDSNGSMNVVDASYALSNLMLAYELFPDVFTDDANIPESNNQIPDLLDEICYEIEWLLKMQDVETGAVYSGITVNNSNNKTVSYVEDVTCESTYAFAYALAKFSYIYQVYDLDFATKCLKAADRAWKYGEMNYSEDNSDYKFAAASEIYRASGAKKCKKYIESQINKDILTDEVSNMIMYGCMTYLNNTQKINTGICEQMMRVIMKKAEDISERSRKSVFSVPSTLNQDNNDELLNDALMLIWVNHVIPNFEYERIIDNYLYYFLGCNYRSICYIDNIGTNNYADINENSGVMRQFNRNSLWVFLLSNVNSQG